MPYKASLQAVEKVLHVLEKLANSNEDTETFQTGSPSSLKYAIHEAFFSAKEMKLQKYATLGENWKVRIKGVKVVCERKNVFATDLISAKDEVKRKRYSVSKFAEVIGSLIAEGNRFTTQHFPGFILASDEETSLSDLMTIYNKRWYYDSDPLNGLTITNKDA